MGAWHAALFTPSFIQYGPAQGTGQECAQAWGLKRGAPSRGQGRPGGPKCTWQREPHAVFCFITPWQGAERGSAAVASLGVGGDRPHPFPAWLSLWRPPCVLGRWTAV